MRLQLFQVPYDSGHRNERMGRGPLHLVQHGAVELLTRDGHEVRVESIESARAFRTEAASAVELCRTLSNRVRAATSRGAVPIVLSGNCNASLGALSGLEHGRLGLVWFDAHGDFNTPETTESGYFDGMGMAIAAGRCWGRLAGTIPHFRSLPESQMLHLGGRDFDAAEAELLHESGVTVLPASGLRGGRLREALEPALKGLRNRVDRVYVHIDLDVLDATEAPANEYGIRVPGGLSVAELDTALGVIYGQFGFAGGGIAAYDPGVDTEDRALHAGLHVLRSLAGAPRTATADVGDRIA